MKDDFKETVITAFLLGLFLGFISMFLVLFLVRTMTAYAGEAPVEPHYIEISEGPETAAEVQPDMEELGTFRLTFYCKGGCCNGYFKDGTPRSVDRYDKPLEWGCVATDPAVIPMHTKLKIEGFDMTFEARDTGSGVNGKHIDVFVPVSHSEALRMWQGEKKKVWRVIE